MIYTCAPLLGDREYKSLKSLRRDVVARDCDPLSTPETEVTAIPSGKHGHPHAVGRIGVNFEGTYLWREPWFINPDDPLAFSHVINDDGSVSLVFDEEGNLLIKPKGDAYRRFVARELRGGRRV